MDSCHKILLSHKNPLNTTLSTFRVFLFAAVVLSISRHSALLLPQVDISCAHPYKSGEVTPTPSHTANKLKSLSKWL